MAMIRGDKGLGLVMWAILLGFSVFWGLVPDWLAQSVALDVSEGVNWGREWQLGYYKHPPLSSWVLYGFYWAFGGVGVYVLSVLCVWASGFFVYRLGRDLLPDRALFAWLGCLCLLLIVYYSYPLVEFNHNVAQLPFWAGLAWVFYAALVKDRWRDWVSVAVLGGLGMLVKYHVVFLLLAMALFLLLPAQVWRLRSLKPWGCAVLMLLVFSPNLFWLMDHDWLPFAYMRSRSAVDNAILGHFSWVGFLLAQAVALLPLLVFWGWAGYKKQVHFRLDLGKMLIAFKDFSVGQSAPDSMANRPQNFALFYLGYIWAMPILILCALSLCLGLGLRDMWGMPMWGLTGLVLLALTHANDWQNLAKILPKALIIWLTLVSAIMVILVGFSDRLRGKPARMHYPQAILAQKTQETWQNLSHCPLDSLSGDDWLIQLTAMKLQDFPSLMIAGSPQYSPWMNPDRLMQHGTLVMGETGQKLDLPLLVDLDHNPNLHVFHGQWQIPWQSIPQKSPLSIEWTAYIPQNCLNSSDKMAKNSGNALN